MKKQSTKRSKIEPYFIAFANDSSLSEPAPKDLIKYSEKEKINVQLKLRKILDGIIETGNLENSSEIQYFIEKREKFITKFKVSDNKIEIEGGLGPNEITRYRSAMEAQWMKGLSSSLIYYLMHEDIRKIKKCEQCKEYYISNQIRSDQKFCSQKCKRMSKWTPERWNEYMQKYRENKRKERQKEYDEMRIQRMVKKGGYPRKEAIKMLKAEKEM